MFFCISGSTLNLLTGTCSVVCIVFPFSDPRLGPKISSDLRMSTHSWETACVLRNQFTRIPLMFWSIRTFCIRVLSKCDFVYLSFTVVTSAVAT